MRALRIDVERLARTDTQMRIDTTREPIEIVERNERLHRAAKTPAVNATGSMPLKQAVRQRKRDHGRLGHAVVCRYVLEILGRRCARLARIGKERLDIT